MGESAHRKTAPASQPACFPQAVKRSTAGAGKLGKQLSSPCSRSWKKLFPSQAESQKNFNKHLYQGGAFSGTCEPGQESGCLGWRGSSQGATGPRASWKHPQSCLLWGKSGLGPMGGQQRRAAKPPYQEDIQVITSLRKSLSSKGPALSQTLPPGSCWIP